MTSVKKDNSPKAARCPICKLAAQADYEPFCSKRCADIDLHRWLSGAYAIPAQDDDSDGVGSDADEPS